MSAPRQLDDGRLEQNIISDDELTNIFSQIRGEFEESLVRTIQRVIGPAMEHLVHKTVKEQFELVQEKLMTSIKCNFGNQASTSKSRNLQLKFLDEISLPVFTGKKIVGEGCRSIRVALVDELTGEVVKSGPEATAKFEIVVREGYSGGNGGDNQNVEDFNNKIVTERKGKKTILKGITCLNLKEGISNIDELSFIHKSTWMKNCELCLGARTVDNFPGTTIKEAKTESFTLKDCRTALYGKRYPPSFCDKVWRLKKIGKKGVSCERLSREGIYTVKDFLKLLFTNPERLQEILRVDDKAWVVITDHARTCKGLYLYYYLSSQQKTGVVFNVVRQVKGLVRESQYFSTDLLSEKEKKDANKSVIRALEHWEEVIPFDDETSLMRGISHSPESPRSESPNGGNHGDPPLINAYDNTQPDNSSHGISSSFNSTWEPIWLDEDDFHSLGDDKLMDNLLSAPEQGSDCLIHIPDYSNDFDVEYYLLNDNNNHQPEIPKLDLQAERRWTMVFFVLKWFRIRRRIGAPEQDHVQKKQRIS